MVKSYTLTWSHFVLGVIFFELFTAANPKCKQEMKNSSSVSPLTVLTKVSQKQTKKYSPNLE